jgi:hypothetical protein
LFLCLVYFAGRTITSKWPHLLAAGALLSSVGQLLIRHFAAPGISPNWLIVLAAFPVVCYVGATIWMLKIALADGEIDESEATEVFTTLGALTFAAVLPFGLLLYKSASAGATMMHLAPLVTLAGMPILATGMLLWRRVVKKDLVATRTAGASIAILGMVMALAGIALGWPNPASVIPAALFNFALFTAVAIFVEEPRAHVVAAACLTLAYVVGFHVAGSHVPWQNLRAVSLLQVCGSVRTGQALTILFVSFVLVHEWLRSRKSDRDAVSYLIAACGVAVASLGLLVAVGVTVSGDPFRISAIVTLYAAGAFWFAWRRGLVGFTWAGAVLLFLASAQTCNSLLVLRFPWQASCLLFAVLCIAGAVAAQRFTRAEKARLFVWPLEASAMFSCVLAAALLVVQLIWFGCEPASVFATRAFILAIVLWGLLWLDGSQVFFAGFQAAFALGAVLLTKSILQRFDWYAFRPNAWADPRALQVQGIILGLICLAWIVTRSVLRKGRAENEPTSPSRIKRVILGKSIAFDQLLALALVIGFAMLLVFGTATGIAGELINVENVPPLDIAGHPHALIFGIGSLVLLVVLLAVMIGNIFERRQEAFVLGTLLVLWSICPLVAGRFESQVATASSARWVLAIFLLIFSLLYAFREKILSRTFYASDVLRNSVTNSRALLLFLTLAPLLLLTLSTTVDAVNYVPIRGPQSGMFHAMGRVALYGIPLVLSVAALGIHAARERSAAFAFAAGLLVNFTVTVVQIVSVAALNGPMNRVVLVNSLQLNAIAAAVVALVWISTRMWWLAPGAANYKQAAKYKPEERPVTPDSGAATPDEDPVERVLLPCQVSFAVVLNALIIIPLLLHLVASPNEVGRATFMAGSFTGWLACFLTIAGVLAYHKVLLKPVHFVGLAVSLLGVAALLSFRFAQLSVANWSGLHVLLGGLVAIAWLLFAARDLARNSSMARTASSIGLPFADGWQSDSEIFAVSVGALAVLVALRGPRIDPTGAWWSIGALLAMVVLAAALNWTTFRRGYAYAGGVLFNVAVSIWLVKYGVQPGNLTGFIKANVVALSLAGIVWLVLELRGRRLAAKSSSAAAFHNVAALAALTVLGIVAGLRLAGDLAGFYEPNPLPLLDLFALASLGLFMTACLWDRDAGYAVAGLYIIGLLAASTVLQQRHLAPPHLIWAVTMAAAIQALVAATLWRSRQTLFDLAARLKIPSRLDRDADELTWLFAFNCTIVTLVVVLVLWVEVVFPELSLRVLASFAVMVQCLTFGLMAQGQRRRLWQRTAVAALLTGAVFLGWSFLVPASSGTWLNRAVILMSLMFATLALFGAGLGKLIEREPDWTGAFRDCVPAISITGIVALGFILGTEIYYQIVFGAVRVSLAALVTVGVTVAAAIVICIFFAVSPKHDPLALSDRWRGGYVYAAEVLLVLLFMHIRLTMPWLFHGFFQRYWPLVVLLIAYAGVAISEFFKRREVHVLATPIERTGAFLPLLPVIGFWIAQSQVEYSTLLFVVGGLYGLLAILRRSFWFGLAAALAGNGGLWYLLHETSEYDFYQHPQLWLIPAAISVLVAAHLNRKDFSESQMTGIRYLCLMTIYASSTADIFINGVANSPWLPLVLAALSLAGVFLGMIFRVRAFLLLGSMFLLLAIATMIKFASVNFGWTWLWYVAGIVTGAAIITTFAVFEKQRAEVLRFVEEFRDWKG